ncbi:hypothetical protein ACQKRQ_06130 [Paraburkholderia sp. NPDC080076]|uniref:hypothetical protein n=1 Tax=Paraburkholderia sp. NPDC080076 TaxID=3390605 RepID=UPI003D04C427
MRLVDYFKKKSLHDSNIDSVELKSDCLILIFSAFDEDSDDEIRIDVTFFGAKGDACHAMKKWFDLNENVGVLIMTCKETVDGYETEIMMESFNYATEVKDFMKISVSSQSADVSLLHR